jgi:hypothetical protein
MKEIKVHIKDIIFKNKTLVSLNIIIIIINIKIYYRYLRFYRKS